MIITIMTIILLIIAIFLMIKSKRDGVQVVGFVMTILCAIMSAIFIVSILCIQICRNVDYQNKLHEKEVLEYRIENMSENVIGNEMLYNDIVEFNNSLRITKEWANNPWTSWFNNKDIANIDYISIEVN